MRIIAGKAKGLSIKAPKTSATRPTQDKVREALFSTIHQMIPETAVLELFAGSGAIGLEAVSRGAASVTLVDSSRQAQLVMRDNISAAKFDAEANVVAGTAESFLKLNRKKFDIIIADPPYHREETSDDWLAWLLAQTELADALADGGLLVLESHSHYRMNLPVSWKLHSEKTYGKSKLWYLFAAQGAPQSAE